MNAPTLWRPGHTPAIMVQGTGSDVGKSVFVAGLCRLFARRGLTVRPFKAQNMSNNAAATPDGGEIGRAQMLQARAARVPASVHLNPVLLKPQSETGAQIVVQGRVRATARAAEYAAIKGDLMAPVLDSFRCVCAGGGALGDGPADLVVVEGAGSASEVNLRAGDIANMGFAEAADVPVLLLADIDRGGVIASVVGTSAVLPAKDRARIAGYVINKFRGDTALFDGGLAAIGAATGWRSFGVVPFFPAAARLPAEDSLGLAAMATHGERPLHVVMPALPHIANFDDADPLRLEPSVRLSVVPLADPLPGDADVVLIPGSKVTRADAAALIDAGWGIDLAAHLRRGGRIVGLCGGYQILGGRIDDPNGLEGPPGSTAGLGLLDVTTRLAAPKVTRSVEGTACVAGGAAVTGYRIHMGRTDGPDCARPVVRLTGDGPDGAVSPDGAVMGTYVHGLFASDPVRGALLREWGAPSDLAFEATVEATLDALADHLEVHVDVSALLDVARSRAAVAAG